MRSTLIMVLFCLGSLLQAQPWSVQVDFDNRVSFRLPESPEIRDTAGSKFALLNLDSTVVLLSRLPSPGTVPNDRALTEHYDGLCQGFLAEVNGKPIDMYDTTLTALRVRYLYFSFTYPKPAQPFGPNFNPQADTATQTDYRRCWFWLLDGQVYALQFWYMGPEQPHHRAFARKLISSLRFSDDAEPEDQFSSSEGKGKAKWDLSWFFFGAAVVLLAVGYMLAKKLRR